jgi:CHAD domain-containing protein
MKRKLDIRWNRRKDAVENVRVALPRLVKAYFALGRKIVHGKVSETRLHEFRLATKRFRYTLEMFVPLYGPGLESRLKHVRKIQQALGDVQDCETVRGLDPVKNHTKLVAWIEKRLESKKTGFQKLWDAEFGSREVEKKWADYLQRYARERKS